MYGMHHYHPHHHDYHAHAHGQHGYSPALARRMAYARRGVPGILGGVIGLTTAALQGGASIVQSIVNNAIWYRTPLPPHGCCHPVHHVHVECSPPAWSCGAHGGCCCR